jgi:hypothetical protein
MTTAASGLPPAGAATYAGRAAEPLPNFTILPAWGGGQKRGAAVGGAGRRGGGAAKKRGWIAELPRMGVCGFCSADAR